MTREVKASVRISEGEFSTTEGTEEHRENNF